jgi:hypothetical protein
LIAEGYGETLSIKSKVCFVIKDKVVSVIKQYATEMGVQISPRMLKLDSKMKWLYSGHSLTGTKSTAPTEYEAVAPRAGIHTVENGKSSLRLQAKL